MRVIREIKPHGVAVGVQSGYSVNGEAWLIIGGADSQIRQRAERHHVSVKFGGFGVG
jgi:hypothetical protein